MNLVEFRDKLRSVPDEQLKRMFIRSRTQGPAVAIPLIFAEARDRGLMRKVTKTQPPSGPGYAASRLSGQAGGPGEVAMDEPNPPVAGKPVSESEKNEDAVWDERTVQMPVSEEFLPSGPAMRPPIHAIPRELLALNESFAAWTGNQTTELDLGPSLATLRERISELLPPSSAGDPAAAGESPSNMPQRHSSLETQYREGEDSAGDESDPVTHMLPSQAPFPDGWTREGTDAPTPPETRTQGSGSAEMASESDFAIGPESHSDYAPYVVPNPDAAFLADRAAKDENAAEAEPRAGAMDETATSGGAGLPEPMGMQPQGDTPRSALRPRSLVRDSIELEEMLAYAALAAVAGLLAYLALRHMLRGRKGD